ncbi:MAG: methyltransferase domain-containing protein [Gammaproteobacteria bacterium]|jgi:predicted methyltransferase|nr:methyltransferase domain-containing protein [Gammaproteobacteria bacterium]
MDCSHAIFALLLLAPCENGGGEIADSAIADSLASPARLEADRETDALRRPDLVLEFFEIEPGMTVLDLFSGAGYYTEIVSRIVGENGKVVAHNNEAYLAYAEDGIAERYSGDRLANVEHLTAEANSLELPDNTFDAALAMLTWHDFYYLDLENGWPDIDEKLVVRKLCSALKPGAVLGVTDHVATAGSEAETSAQNLHRIDPQRIRKDFSDSCFEYEGEINVLRNPDDDLSQPMFAEGIRGQTDRVVYRFRKKLEQPE